MKTTILFVAVAIMLTACEKKESADQAASSQSAMSLAMPAGNGFVGENYSVTAPNSNNFKTLSWKVTNESGFDLTRSCTSPDSGRTLNCLFEEAGQMTFSLTATDRSGAVSNFSALTEVLDTSKRPNQPPVLVLRIKKAGVVVATISNNLKFQTGQTNFEAGEYDLDISGSSDDHDASPSYTIRFGATAAFGVIPAKKTFDVGTPIEVTIKGRDSEGETSQKSFLVFASCPPPVTLVVDSLSATFKSGNLYDFTAAVSGAPTGSTVRLMWDYNADGVWDGDWIEISKANTKFVNWAGSRHVRVRAWDSVCNFQVIRDEVVALPTPRLAHDGNLATPEQSLDFGNGGNYFIQADLSSTLSGTASPSVDELKGVNGDSIVTKRVGQKPDDSIRCNYNKNDGSFQLLGLNHYDKGIDLGTPVRNPMKDHGFELRINGLGTQGLADDGLQPVVVAREAYYRTDISEDSTYLKRTFAQSNCPLSIWKKTAKGVAPCDPSVTGVGAPMKDATILYGKFECQNMVAGADGSVLKAAKGAFYCEVQSVDQCVGGGGGGGGGVPPKQY
ncbi:MAG: hypothetical protein JNM39_18240 [Bdellovibrionaceae bacterium]|nr:hypothetical protein [Pseudobdellovibrionaceae bacterium]